MKVFSVTKVRKGLNVEVVGTIPELVKYFGYTLEAGHSYDSKVNLEPKTAKGLLSALNRATEVTQSGSFNPTTYSIEAFSD